VGKFRIGQFDIDGSRCKISSADSELIVEPKVMDVLQVLYQNRGSVISQEAIFAAVWPNSTFNPSSVQRSIALLRKALNEDSKNAQFIITHPKRGYSLELPEQDEVKVTRTHKLSIAIIAVFTLCVGLWFSTQTSLVKTDFSRLTPITSNEENESYPALSHDGKYLAFIRGNDHSRTIWLKELASGREIQFTPTPSHYYNLGWSKDDSALAFMEDNAGERILAYANFDKVSLLSTGFTELTRFPQYQVGSTKLQWGNDGLLYFVETDKGAGSTSLTSLNVKDGSRTKIKPSKGQDWLLTLALSSDEEHMALAYEAGQNQYRVELFHLADKTSETLLEVEDGIQGLSWHPESEHLLVSQRSNLLLVDLTGDAQKLDFDNYHMIRDAVFDPSGQEILMELVNIDFDIIATTRENPDSYETLVNTNAEDFLPVYSPDSSKFVFESRRSGLKQLYVYEQGKQRMIFANPDNEEMFGMVWSKDSKIVIAASKDKLFKIDVESGEYEVQPHPHHSFYLREMFTNEEAILVSYREGDGSTFNAAKLDLTTLSLDTYTGSGKKLACFSMGLDDSDRIYFANHEQVFRINDSGDVEPVWRSEQQSIAGVKVAGDIMSLVLEENDEYQIVEHSLLDGSQQVVFSGKDDGNMLTNSSHDNQQFLYLTKPELTKRLVRLR